MGGQAVARVWSRRACPRSSATTRSWPWRTSRVPKVWRQTCGVNCLILASLGDLFEDLIGVGGSGRHSIVKGPGPRTGHLLSQRSPGLPGLVRHRVIEQDGQVINLFNSVDGISALTHCGHTHHSCSCGGHDVFHPPLHQLGACHSSDGCQHSPGGRINPGHSWLELHSSAQIRGLPDVRSIWLERNCRHPCCKQSVSGPVLFRLGVRFF